MNQDAGRPPGRAADEAVPEVELADEDILDAMQHIPGYVDISTADFREVYHLAHRHATDRLLGGLRAANLMRPVAAPLPPGMMLDEAARAIVASGFKGLPVVDADGLVVGMLTETDFLCRLQAGTFLELLLRIVENSCEVRRRAFLTTTAAAGAGFLLGAAAVGNSGAASAGADRKKRYALVGTGGRSAMYREAVLETYGKHCEMAGFCDVNLGRLKLAQFKARERAGVEVPIYEAKDFDRRVRETKPDAVIVTTKDVAHSDYIVRAMELGCDVITEKPMTTDEKKCRAIFDAQRKTERHCRVTFNYRYSPPRTQVKDLLMSGVIGDVLSVDFHWLLDTFHGADYFSEGI